MQNTKMIYQDEVEIKKVLEKNGYTVTIIDHDGGENFDKTFDINILSYSRYSSTIDRVNAKYPDRPDEHKYDICFIFKGLKLFSTTTKLTESYLLSIFDFECIICKEEFNKDMNCQACGKRICFECIYRMAKYGNDTYRCPACRKCIFGDNFKFEND